MKKIIKTRTRWCDDHQNYVPHQHLYDDGSVETVLSEESLTQQQFKESCDVNNIVKSFLDSGDNRLIMKTAGQSMDLSNVPDYDEMLRTVIAAEEAFSQIDANIRKRFDNDPRQWMEWLNDKNNEEEAIKLGFREKPTPPEPNYQKEMYNELKTMNQNNEKVQKNKSKSETGSE